MATDTDVFVQRTALIKADTVNPVTTSNLINSFTDREYDSVLYDDLLPKSFATTVRKVAHKLDQGDPDYHPDGLPVINFFDEPLTEQAAQPMFWIRNQNIDLDSCWWNIFSELGLGNNHTTPTDLNDSYWHRSLDDPDIDRIPADGYPLLSSRGVHAFFFDGKITAAGAVPYELVYPEWFTAHPEYIKTDAIVKKFGLDLKLDVLVPFRENENQRDIDNIWLGFFTSLLPGSRAEAEYSHKFFREVFKDLAFASTIAQSTSPCVEYALDAAGLYANDGALKGFINDEGVTLAQKKANNYYYEYKASTDPAVDLEKVFVFTDPKNQMSIEFTADEILIRKVRGNIRNVTQYGHSIETVVGKGMPFPEFIHFKDSLYPEDPTAVTPTFSSAELNDYDDNVTQLHIDAFEQDEGAFVPVYPVAWIATRMQKEPSKYSANHPWDSETATDLNFAEGLDYYEEIIVINPRVEYRGIYSTPHRSIRAYEAFHSGDTWETTDNPNFLRWSTGSSAYVPIDAGTSFTDSGGDEESSDAIVLPTIVSVTNQLRLKEREELIARSFSVITMSVVRTHTSWRDEILPVVMAIVTIVLVLTGLFNFAEGLKQAIAEKAFTGATKYLLKSYIGGKLFLAAADEIVEVLAKELGYELAGQIVAVITLAVTAKTLQDPTAAGDDMWLKLASNFDDSFVEISQERLEGIQEKSALLQAEQKVKMDKVEEQYEDLLLSEASLNNLRTYAFQFTDEPLSDLISRTIEDKNPGTKVYEFQEFRYTVYKSLDFKKTPMILTVEQTDEEYLNNLV